MHAPSSYVRHGTVENNSDHITQPQAGVPEDSMVINGGDSSMGALVSEDLSVRQIERLT